MKYESSNQESGLVLEKDDKKSADEATNPNSLDGMPYEDFIFATEEEILSEKIDELNDNCDQLKKHLKRIEEKKESFVNKIESDERKLLAKILFEIIEIILKNLIESKVGYREKEFKIGDSEWQQEVILFVDKNKNNPEKLRSFWEEYKALFAYEDSEESGNKYAAGIMAPLGLKNILKEKYGLKVFYAKPKEDVECAVDMIAIDDKNKLNLLIQVKTDKTLIEKMIKEALNDEKNRREKDIANEKKEGKELIKAIPRFEFGNNGTETNKDYASFSNGCLKYVENNRDLFKDKDFKTIGVYAYVPYVLFGEKFIEMNGVPSSDKLWETLVWGGLETKLSLPNMFDYDTV